MGDDSCILGILQLTLADSKSPAVDRSQIAQFQTRKEIQLCDSPVSHSRPLLEVNE